MTSETIIFELPDFANLWCSFSSDPVKIQVKQYSHGCHSLQEHLIKQSQMVKVAKHYILAVY